MLTISFIRNIVSYIILFQVHSYLGLDSIFNNNINLYLGLQQHMKRNKLYFKLILITKLYYHIIVLTLYIIMVFWACCLSMLKHVAFAIINYINYINKESRILANIYGSKFAYNIWHYEINIFFILTLTSAYGAQVIYYLCHS